MTKQQNGDDCDTLSRNLRASSPLFFSLFSCADELNGVPVVGVRKKRKVRK